MLTKTRTNRLSRAEVRLAFELDLATKGGAIKRGVLYAESLMECTPGAWQSGGTYILCGMQAIDFVVEGLRRMLAGKRRVHRFDSGLLAVVRDLVTGARSGASNEALLHEVAMRFGSPAPEAAADPVTTLFDDPRTAEVARGLLRGRSAIEIADGVGGPFRDVLVRVRRVQRAAGAPV